MVMAGALERVAATATASALLTEVCWKRQAAPRGLRRAAQGSDLSILVGRWRHSERPVPSRGDRKWAAGGGAVGRRRSLIVTASSESSSSSSSPRDGSASASSSSPSPSPSPSSPSMTKEPAIANPPSRSSRVKRVVILGGTGRVGSSVAAAMARLPLVEDGDGGSPSTSKESFSRDGVNGAGARSAFDIVIAGRNRVKGEQVLSMVGGGAEFCECDIDDKQSLARAMDGADLVIHTAGPFQRAERCSVLEVAIQTKTPYIDVCDDAEYSRRAKSLHERAREAGVPAITTTGIYPGISNLMAAELVRLARCGDDDQETNVHRPDKLRFSYFTAGTGGAGPTILATSFLLLGEDVEAYRDDELVIAKPWSGRKEVDFGLGVGPKEVYLLNLPEVASAFKILKVPSVSARFGTDPFFWNLAMEAVAALVPKEMLQDRNKVEPLVKLSYPFVQAFDKYVGEKMSMRVDLECTDGVKSVALYTHKYLSRAVGVATSAFARAVLEGYTKPGVWFPEEEDGIPVEHRQELLQRGSEGTSNFVMNRSPWAVETPPREVGFGIYF